MTGFERESFLCVVAMNAERAKSWAMPNAAKVVYAGQADPLRYKFGARIYFLFATLDDYNTWLRAENYK